MVSKALVVGAYHGKLVALAREPDIELMAVVPESWIEGGLIQRAEDVAAEGYSVHRTSLRLNGRYHVYTYRDLSTTLRNFRPDLVHIDEEPYNLATLQACRASLRLRAGCVFFAWQNLARRYPPPFRWIESWVYRRADGIAGTGEALRVLREKGFKRRCAVIPQFGIDPNVFAPLEAPRPRDVFRIGWAGRMVSEKGVQVLIEAVRRIDPPIELVLAGSGPYERELRALAHGVRVRFLGPLPSHGMPGFFRSLDCVVMPTIGRPGWVEQFGRSVVEAMACGVPTVVSDAGELPHLVDDAGIVVPRGNVEALRTALESLRGDITSRHRLAKVGRAHVLAHYTHGQIAAQTAAFYREVLGSSSP